MAADVGFCALDRKRRPLTGRELRGCWSERPAIGEAQAAAAGAERDDPLGTRRPARPMRGFVPVDEVDPLPAEPFVSAPILLLGDPAEPWETRTSLFGELDR